jgi:hypothetical protein
MDVSSILIVMYDPFSVSCVLSACKCVLMPPGVNPIADKHISYIIMCNESVLDHQTWQFITQSLFTTTTVKNKCSHKSLKAILTVRIYK